MLHIRFLFLIARGRVDEAFNLIARRRVTLFGIHPRQAHLVRAGLAAGRLLDKPLVPKPVPRIYLCAIDQDSSLEKP